MIRLRYKLGAIAAVILAVVGWLHFRHPVTGVVLPKGVSLNQLNKPQGDFGHGFVFKQKGKDIVMLPKVMGFPFDLGATIAMGGRSSQLYLTTEIFFYRHFEVLAGLGITYPVIHPRAFAGLGYRMPWKKLNNLSVVGGISSANEFVLGVYWRFGGS